MNSYSHYNNKHIPFDLMLDTLFGSKTNGFFIELGANDGINQSNTAFFEFHRQWKGVLIEPSPNAFLKCVESRPNSKCFNTACVSNKYTNSFIEGDFNGSMMASVNGMRTHNQELIKVKTATLESILDSIHIEKIDFLSLDAEGYEYEILNGLNLDKYRPTYMLIEIYTKDFDKLVFFLERNNYKLLMNLSNYNPIENPGYDGTHNDYIFIDLLNNAYLK